MLFHELRQDLVLLLQLGLQKGNALLRLFVHAGRRPEGRGAVLKELLEPAVEDGGVDLMFVAQSGNRNLIDQVPTQNGDLLLRGVTLALVVHEPSVVAILTVGLSIFS